MARSKEIKKHEKELALRNFRFNRFLFIRYALAFSVIANLYWLFMNLFTQVSSIILPGAMVVLGGMAAFEYLRIYWTHQNTLKFSKIYFQTQIVVNVLLFFATFNESVFSYLYPFLGVSNEAILLVYIILGVGLVVAGISLFKVLRIAKNKDKKYQYIQRYEKYTS
ncbi:hypothetical protein [Aerococcus urinaeequi]|uniref:PTS cellobiose transporter subunit IIA n=1 Tax=Aerococcus urinaeequi TaxID=51665 RepID=A0AAC8X149_9LACT|nr:hypothetical protein [Aerococcus urinaeequi]AMB97931.1 hypothetical protein AWM74_06680 [Aerococcus urinaeequi]